MCARMRWAQVLFVKRIVCTWKRNMAVVFRSDFGFIGPSVLDSAASPPFTHTRPLRRIFTILPRYLQHFFLHLPRHKTRRQTTTVLTRKRSWILWSTWLVPGGWCVMWLEAFTDLEILLEILFPVEILLVHGFLEKTSAGNSCSECWPDEQMKNEEWVVWTSQHEFAYILLHQEGAAADFKNNCRAICRLRILRGDGTMLLSAQLTVKVRAVEVLRLSVYGTLHVQKNQRGSPCQHTLSVEYEAYVWLYHLDPLQY